MMNDLLQNKLDRLDKVREEMYASVASLSEAQLHDKAYGWCVIEVFAHLNDTEAGTIQYMSKKMKAGDKLSNHTFSNKIRMKLSNLVTDSPLRWKAPKFLSAPDANYTLSEMKERWEATRNATKTYVQTFPDELLKKAVFRHPIAGMQDLYGAIDSMTYHQLHHMRQLKRIKKEIGA